MNLSTFSSYHRLYIVFRSIFVRQWWKAENKVNKISFYCLKILSWFAISKSCLFKQITRLKMPSYNSATNSENDNLINQNQPSWKRKGKKKPSSFHAMWVVETIKRFNHCRTSLQHQCLLKSGEPFIDLGNSKAPAALLDCIFILNKRKAMFSFSLLIVTPPNPKS